MSQEHENEYNFNKMFSEHSISNCDFKSSFVKNEAKKLR